MPRNSRTVIIDNHPACYDARLTRGWAKKMLLLGRKIPKLDEAIFDFVAELRATAHNARLPYDMLQGMKSFHDGYVRESKIESPVERVAKAVVWNIGSNIPEFTVEQLNKIKGVCLDLGTKLTDLRNSLKLEFPAEQAWTSFIGTKQFQLTLWGLQRTCYVSIYNAYESFGTTCVAVAKRQPSYRKKSFDKFKATICETLGSQVFDDCFDNSFLKRAELIRHSLSHAGGRKTADLRAIGHVDRTPDGRVQVTAMDVRDLLKFVEERGLQLARATTNCLTVCKPR